MKTLNQLYKTLDSCAPFNGDAEKRAEYLEQCLKHIMAIAKNGCKEKRIIETVEESIGWLTPHETTFAVDYVQNTPDIQSSGSGSSACSKSPTNTE